MSFFQPEGTDRMPANPSSDSSAAPHGSSVDTRSERGGGFPPGIPPPPARRQRSSVWPFVLAAAVAIALGAAAVYLAHQRRSGAGTSLSSGPLEVGVHTEPDGVPVTIDGRPVEGDRVRFQPGDGAGVLEARRECRTATHRIDPSDAGREIELVLEPTRVSLPVGEGLPRGARVRLNGEDAGPVPLTLALDLCRENQIQVAANDHRPALVRLPGGASPLEARTALAGIRLEETPRGRLVFPKTPWAVVWYVDGARARSIDEGIELTEGIHAVRAVNAEYWVDVRGEVKVEGGRTVAATLDLPSLALLSVQAFPANCKIYVRRPRGAWRHVDDTPATLRLAAGSYEVKVQFVPTGEEKQRDVRLRPGENPPIRFAFGEPS